MDQSFTTFHWGCKTRAIWISKTQPLAATCSHSSCRKWPQVAAGGCRSKWPQVAASGRTGAVYRSKWPQVAASGHRGLSEQVAASGGKRPQWAAGGCRSKWPQVAASGRKCPQVAAGGCIGAGSKWPKVAASGRKWPQVAARVHGSRLHPQVVGGGCWAASGCQWRSWRKWGGRKWRAEVVASSRQ